MHGNPRPRPVALLLLALSFAHLAPSVFAAPRLPPAPENGFLPGTSHSFYGRDHEGWTRLRRFFDHKLYGRHGQHQLLDILEGHPAKAIADAQQRLAADPKDLESLFTLCVARSVLNDLEGALQALHTAVERGLPFERFLAGPREILRPLRETPEFRQYAARKNIRLLHGPTLGALTDTSARFWVRTLHASQVEVRASLSPQLSDAVSSTPVHTRPETDYTAVAEVTGLHPATRYYYSVWIDGQPVRPDDVPSFTTHAPTGSGARFQVGFGGGALYTPSNERMWDTILSHRPAAFLFLGDNVYIDLPQQFGALHSYTYYRRQSRPEFRRLASTVPLYAIWDDHDAAIDDCWLGPFRDKPVWKMSMLTGFRNNWNNPAYGDPTWPGCWFKFSIADVDFFLLDGRFYRTNPYSDPRTLLGPVQKTWLLEGLAKSTARVKVLASPVPWAFDTKGKSRDTWNGYQDERNEIFAFIQKQKINGVVLVSADRHRSDARRIDQADAYPFYEFESSRLTNTHVHGLVDGAIFGYNKKQSFGLLTFDTQKPDPTVTFDIINIDNEPIHRLTVHLSEISHP